MRRNCERRPSPLLFLFLTAPKRGNVHKLLKYHNKIDHRKEIAHYLEALFEAGDPTLGLQLGRCCPREGHVANRAGVPGGGTFTTGY